MYLVLGDHGCCLVFRKRWFTIQRQMKLKFSLFLMLLLPLTNILRANPQGPGPTGFTVYLFLGEECIISQQYTLLIKRLHQEYASEKITFVGLFPNPSSSLEKIAKFQEKYALPFPLKLDHLQRKMNEFSVAVTPEVVVFAEDEKKVLYQGRIDNTFFRVGKRRTITTTAELEEVLTGLQNGQPISPYKTDAVGCIITPVSGMMKNLKMCNPGEQPAKVEPEQTDQ